MSYPSGESFTEKICEIIRTCGESGVKHFSMKKDGFDVEFVLGGEVALTPASNLYPKQQIVENDANVYDNDTKQDELPDEPNIADLALEDPELYEHLMKEQLNG